MAPSTTPAATAPSTAAPPAAPSQTRFPRLRLAAGSARALASTGIVRPYGPVTLGRLGRTLVRWGTGLAGGYASLAARMPDEVAIVDEAGTVTFGEVHRQSNALARALAERGVGEGDGVALMARNHRWFVVASVAVAKLGADTLYLNTAFSGPQLGEVLGRERPAVLLHDEEFGPLLADAPVGSRILSWVEDPASGPAEPDVPTVEQVLAGQSDDDLRPPARQGRSVILTSGTTGTPKGASRGAGGLDAAASLVSRMPLRHRWTVHVAAPMFHTWGWAHVNLGMLIGSTLVLRRRFDPEDLLATVSRHRCDAVAVIPVMMQRVLALPEEVRSAYDLTSVQVVASSGSALPGGVATAWMDSFGEHLYNIYGSTECAWVSIATPADLREAPHSAGRPPLGTDVRLYDEAGQEVPAGETGRIFVSNSMLFEGYTGGGDKDRIGGAMATGDVGRLVDGVLFVEGRDDDMIVSGGENVFPQEVEDCLMQHAAVVDAAAIGVEDEEFGQRLRAFVVTADGVPEGEAATALAEELRHWVRDRLARYKAPREVRFLAELPRNATGKVLKRDLAADGPA